MRAAPHEGGCWPTPEQRLLLRASLLEGSAATEAWSEWHSRVDIQVLDRGSLRLLPLLYRNLHLHGVDDPLMDRLKGFYRFTWYKNQTLFQTMQAPLVSLQQAGIPTLLLKGASLALLYYRDPGLRPMEDVDVLVPTARALEALHLLERLGWRPFKAIPGSGQTTFSFLSHGVSLKNDADKRIDLHWHLMPECTGATADDDFWAAARETPLNSAPVQVLHPTDELLNVCIHGSQWNRTPPFRWVADAMMILGSSRPSVDWNRLTAQAQQRRLLLRLKAALCYLRDEIDASIPAETLPALDRIRASKLEQIDFQAVTGSPGATRPLRRLCHHYLNYRRQLDYTPPGRHPLGFLNYVKQHWGLTLWELPFWAIARWLRGVGQMLLNIYDRRDRFRKGSSGNHRSQPEKV